MRRSINPGFRVRLLSLQHSPHGMLRWIASVLLRLGTARQIAVNPTFRAEIFTRLRHRRQHFQRSTFTREDRYPLLFAYAQKQLQQVPAATILSFGCSSGEEVFTLARYLPAAHIIGVDINLWCIQQCRSKNKNPNLTFHQAHAQDIAAHPPCDAIFCLAVFQRTENSGGFRFLQFTEAIASLDRQLKPGGLLFIDHADFSFADTPTAANYQAANFPDNVCTRNRPLFGPDEKLASLQTTLARVFRKIA